MGQFPSTSIYAALLAWTTWRIDTLPSMNADPDSVTVSGFSGGSWYATILHVSNSERIAGVGLLNGGAYASLKENDDLLNRDRSTRDIKDFDEYYTKNEEIANADNFIKETNDFEAKGKIDPLINLTNPFFTSFSLLSISS